MKKIIFGSVSFLLLILLLSGCRENLSGKAISPDENDDQALALPIEPRQGLAQPEMSSRYFLSVLNKCKVAIKDNVNDTINCDTICGYTYPNSICIEANAVVFQSSSGGSWYLPEITNRMTTCSSGNNFQLPAGGTHYQLRCKCC